MKKWRTKFFKLKIFLAFFLLLLAGKELFSQSPLKILLSNDDGIQAPGIAAIFEKLFDVNSVTVAAPSRNYSSVGHGITAQDPIIVEVMEKKGAKWYSIGALPATCVRLALESLLSSKPDILISGINSGENIGVVTFYSATVACAREAAFKGIPSLAISLESGPAMDYGPAARFIAKLMDKIKEKGLKSKIFLNINFPNLPEDQIKGVMITRQDTRPSLEFYERRINPKGKIYFWPYHKPLSPGTEKTDVWALRNGYISITPFQFDLTDYPALDSLEAWASAQWKK